MKILPAIASFCLGVAAPAFAEKISTSSTPTTSDSSTSTSTSTSSAACQATSSTTGSHPHVSPPPEGSMAATLTTWCYYDDHNSRRATAFGSIMLEKNGVDVAAWKKIQAFYECYYGPIASEGFDAADDPLDTTIPGQPEPVEYTCRWSNFVTTDYEFTECPDGRAFVARKGKGVSLTSIRTGEFFDWEEVITCSEDPIGGDTEAFNQVGEIAPLDPATLTIRYGQ